MTGRELIIYIMENGLENEQIYQGGRFLGFMTAIEAAIKFDVGLATVSAWVRQGMLDGLIIGGEFFIPANAERPKDDILMCIE